ncbi:MAG: BrnT family toxin [Anaerolineae bacterium]|nr:BrnT family toxin [Anaerolineae bacterium]
MGSRRRTEFEWDTKKDLSNQEKHGVSFIIAQYAFADPNRVILEDVTHSTADEKRYFCLGQVGEGILTVRFTYREQHIRIFGAGYWRKGKRIYEEQNQL